MEQKCPFKNEKCKEYDGMLCKLNGCNVKIYMKTGQMVCEKPIENKTPPGFIDWADRYQSYSHQYNSSGGFTGECKEFTKEELEALTRSPSGCACSVAPSSIKPLDGGVLEKTYRTGRSSFREKRFPTPAPRRAIYDIDKELLLSDIIDIRKEYDRIRQAQTFSSFRSKPNQRGSL